MGMPMSDNLESKGNGRNWRVPILAGLTVIVICAICYAVISSPGTPREMNQAQLFDLIKQGRVTSIVNEPDPSTGIRTLTGTYKEAVGAIAGAIDSREGAFKVPVDLQLNPYLASEIQQAGYKGTIETRNNANIFWPLFINLVPVIVFGGWMLFICVCLTRILYKAAFGPSAT